MSKPQTENPIKTDQPEQKQKNEIDILHDDEFEDFQIKYNTTKSNEREGEWNDDWDDDNVENFASILREQRSKFH